LGVQAGAGSRSALYARPCGLSVSLIRRKNGAIALLRAWEVLLACSKYDQSINLAQAVPPRVFPRYRAATSDRGAAVGQADAGSSHSTEPLFVEARHAIIAPSLPLLSRYMASSVMPSLSAREGVLTAWPGCTSSVSQPLRPHISAAWPATRATVKLLGLPPIR
jgi:hypothetical protein